MLLPDGKSRLDPQLHSSAAHFTDQAFPWSLGPFALVPRRVSCLSLSIGLISPIRSTGCRSTFERGFIHYALCLAMDSRFDPEIQVKRQRSHFANAGQVD